MGAGAGGRPHQPYRHHDNRHNHQPARDKFTGNVKPNGQEYNGFFKDQCRDLEATVNKLRRQIQTGQDELIAVKLNGSERLHQLQLEIAELKAELKYSRHREPLRQGSRAQSEAAPPAAVNLADDSSTNNTNAQRRRARMGKAPARERLGTPPPTNPEHFISPSDEEEEESSEPPPITGKRSRGGKPRRPSEDEEPALAERVKMQVALLKDVSLSELRCIAQKEDVDICDGDGTVRNTKCLKLNVMARRLRVSVTNVATIAAFPNATGGPASFTKRR